MELVSIKTIKANPKNPRLIKDDKFRKLVKSIQDFPQMLQLRPIVVDENNIILGGNMRFKALQEAGHKEVFIIRANELTDEQKDEFIVKDNVGFGEWDWDSLANEWNAEKLNEWGLEVPVFNDEVNLDDFFQENDQSTEKEDKFRIVLEYTEEDYNEIIELFGKKGGSREQIVFELLKSL